MLGYQNPIAKRVQFLLPRGDFKQIRDCVLQETVKDEIKVHRMFGVSAIASGSSSYTQISVDMIEASTSKVKQTSNRWSKRSSFGDPTRESKGAFEYHTIKDKSFQRGLDQAYSTFLPPLLNSA